MAEKKAADLEKEAREIKKEIEELESRLDLKLKELKMTALGEKSEVSGQRLPPCANSCIVCHGGCTAVSYSPTPFCDGSCVRCSAY